MRILHVTECYGGGVSKAINTFTELAPGDVEHYLLWTGEDSPEYQNNFSVTRSFSDGTLSRIQDVRRFARSVQPDLILAHSSWAGFYARLGIKDIPVIYQPHCYVFEDKSRSLLSRGVFYAAEKVLSLNTKATVVLSPRENKLSRSLNPLVSTIMLPNVNSLGIVYQEKTDKELENFIAGKSGQRTTISMLGRITRQKDPHWFLEAVKIYRRAFPQQQADFLWIGDGDEETRKQLEEAGITVTGWKNSTEIRQILEGTDIYLHSASYEGFPLAVLDALSLDIPALVRGIPAYEGTSLKLVSSPAEAANQLGRLAESNQEKIKLIKQQRQLMKTMNQETQAEAIRKILSH